MEYCSKCKRKIQKGETVITMPKDGKMIVMCKPCSRKLFPLRSRGVNRKQGLE